MGLPVCFSSWWLRSDVSEKYHFLCGDNLKRIYRRSAVPHTLRLHVWAVNPSYKPLLSFRQLTVVYSCLFCSCTSYISLLCRPFLLASASRSVFKQVFHQGPAASWPLQKSVRSLLVPSPSPPQPLSLSLPHAVNGGLCSNTTSNGFHKSTWPRRRREGKSQWRVCAHTVHVDFKCARSETFFSLLLRGRPFRDVFNLHHVSEQCLTSVLKYQSCPQTVTIITLLSSL